MEPKDKKRESITGEGEDDMEIKIIENVKDTKKVRIKGNQFTPTFWDRHSYFRGMGESRFRRFIRFVMNNTVTRMSNIEICRSVF